MKSEKWLLCPVCQNKTRLRLREDTILENFPLYCPKCKQETLINAKQMNISSLSVREADNYAYNQLFFCDCSWSDLLLAVCKKM